MSTPKCYATSQIQQIQYCGIQNATHRRRSSNLASCAAEGPRVVDWAFSARCSRLDPGLQVLLYFLTPIKRNLNLTVFQDLSIIGQGKGMQPYDYHRSELHTGKSGPPIRARSSARRLSSPASCSSCTSGTSARGGTPRTTPL